MFRFQFTWLSVHKLYRVVLVACSTYITDPLVKLCSLSVVLIAMSVGNTMCKPYKDRTANNVAILSYVVTICIAFISVMKTMLVTFDCKVNCGLQKDTVLWYLDNVEKVLLLYILLGVIPLGLLYMLINKCRGKNKKE